MVFQMQKTGFKSLVALCGLIASPFYVGNLAMAEPLLHAKPMTKAQARDAGYESHVFSFKAPSLDFETYIPKGADVETLEYKTTPIPDGQVGRVLPIGQMRFTKDNVDYENIIFSYRLRNPPAALRTCKWYLTGDGYQIIHSNATSPLKQAEMLGIKANKDGQPETASIAYCYARGDNLIGQYFMAKLPTNPIQAGQAVTSLRDIAADYVANIKFLDNKPIALDPDQIATKKLELDGQNLDLSYPKALEVSKADNKITSLPYEIYFTQNLQNGSPFSYLLFAIHPISGPNREESFRNLAEAYVHNYVETQKKAGNIEKDAETDFIEQNSLSGYASQGIGARSYQYKISSPKEDDKPTLFQITLVRQGDKLYVIYYHSLRTDSASAGGYFTGSTGDVAYDMLRSSLQKFLFKNKSN